MRITNNMTTNRMLMNINRNSRAVNNLYMQLSTGRIIQNPSDNPIIASRALRFRTNYSDVRQFQRNTAQAQSWMETTEAAMRNMEQNMRNIGPNLMVQGATGTLTFQNRQTIVQEINQLFAQISSEMNQTFGGRFVFSGFRTDRPPIMTHNAHHPLSTGGLNVNHRLEAGDVETFPLHFWRDPQGRSVMCPNHMGTGWPSTTPISNGLHKMGMIPDPDSEGNYMRDPSAAPFNVWRLPYNHVDNAFPDGTGGMIDRTIMHVSLTDSSGNVFSEAGGEIVRMSINGDDNPWMFAQGYHLVAHANGYAWEPTGQGPTIVFIPETGEIIIPNNDPAAFDNLLTHGASVDYNINGMMEGELNPFIFFTTEDVASGRTYNQNNQEIQFEFGTNVRLTVNTQARHAYPWQLFADLTNFIRLVNSVENSAGLDDDIALAAENGFFGSVLYERFGNMLTFLETHTNTMTTEFTTLGARMNRIELIEGRLEENRETFYELMNDNENVDPLEAIMRLNSLEALLQAAMMVGARISQLSLANFI